MRRVFFSNLVYVILLNLLVKPVWVLGIDREVQNILGHSDYGFYFALFNTSYIFNILMDMGLTYYNSRAVSGNPSLIKTFFAQAIFFKTVLSTIYIILTLVAAFGWGISGVGLLWLAFLCFNQVLQSLTLYLRSNLSALQHYRLDSFISVADKLLMVILFAPILLIHSLRNQFTVEWFIYGQTLCYVLTAVIALWLNLSKTGTLTFSINRSLLLDIWRRSYPYAVLVLFMTIYTRADGIMLERFVSDTETGIYASGYRLYDAANQFGYLFAILLMPMFSRMIANKSNVQSLTESGFAMLFLFTVVAATGSLIYRNDLMHLLYREANNYSSNVFAIVMFALPGCAGVYIFGTLLAANANVKTLNIVTGCGALLNILLNLWAIPKYGALGAAVAAVITQSTVGIIEMFVVIRIFKFNNVIRLGVRLALFGVGAFTLFALSKYYITTWCAGITIGFITASALAFVLKLVHPQQLMEAIRLKTDR